MWASNKLLSDIFIMNMCIKLNQVSQNVWLSRKSIVSLHIMCDFKHIFHRFLNMLGREGKHSKLYMEAEKSHWKMETS